MKKAIFLIFALSTQILAQGNLEKLQSHISTNLQVQLFYLDINVAEDKKEIEGHIEQITKFFNLDIENVKSYTQVKDHLDLTESEINTINDKSFFESFAQICAQSFNEDKTILEACLEDELFKKLESFHFLLDADSPLLPGLTASLEILKAIKEIPNQDRSFQKSEEQCKRNLILAPKVEIKVLRSVLGFVE